MTETNYVLWLEGINHSNADEKEKAEITERISKYAPHDEIQDGDAFEDYSYFFYKGYFIGGGEEK